MSEMLRSLGVVIALLHVLTANAAAQSIHSADVLARATSLSAAGEFEAVVALLEPYVRKHPSSAEAWLLLAQHRYWEKEIADARRTFQDALEHHSDHTDLRLSFAQFLMENGESERAREILRPLGRDNAAAEVIRGNIAWWAGDLAAAARYFKRAVELDPGQSEAASALASIRKDARPWIRIGGERSSDSQPLSHGGGTAEAGFFLTPLQTLRAELRHARFYLDETVEPISLLSTGVQVFWPAVKLETRAKLGLIARTENTDWTAIIGAGLRLPYGLRVGLEWERIPYLYTVASIGESVMTEGAKVVLEIDKNAWLGEASVIRESFPDDNTKLAAFGWLMGPLLKTRMLTLQAGYAFSYQDTREHRFTPVLTDAPRPGQSPEWEGRYDPYYTPLDIQTHSVIGSIAVHPTSTVTLHGNASYGFAGSEDAPYVYVVGRAPMTDVYDHSIHPWNVRGSISFAVHPDLTITAEGSHMATTWYDASTLDLSLYVRF